MKSELVDGGLAFLLTYLLHSTVLLAGVWVLVRARVVRSLATENGLWKAALVGGILTAAMQSGLGLQPWSGSLPMRAGAGAAERAAATPPSMLAPAPPRSAEVRAARVEREAPFIASVGRAVLAERERERATSAVPPRAAAPPVEPVEPVEPVRRARSGRAGADATLALVLGLWIALAGLGIARFALLRRRLRRALAGRRPVADEGLLAILARLRRDSGLRREVRLSQCAAVPGPIAIGRREICLPPRAVTDLDPDRQEAILAHELAHLVRRDPAWLAIGAFVEAALFFQPLNRLARRRMRETAEFLCDDWAVARTGRGLVLARCLAQVAEWIEEGGRPLPAAAMARPDSSLVRRVRRLAEGSHAPAAARPLRGTLLGLAALGAVSCGVPAISPEGHAGLLARLLAAWQGSDAEGRADAGAPGGDPEVALVVGGGVVVGVRVDGREIALEQPVRAEGAEEPEEPEEPEEQGCDEDEEEEEEPEGDEPRWDSRSLFELSARMQEIERAYATRHRQLTAGHAQRLQSFESECRQELDGTDRELQTWIARWAQAYQSRQSERQAEWQRASQKVNQELARLQQRHGADPEAYRERFEEWRERYEEELEEHEERWREWESETRSEYEEAVAAYRERREQREEHWIEGREHLAEEHEEELEQLDEWFQEAYEELREAFESSVERRRGNPCDHDCKRRCANGCTHPEDEPEEVEEPADAPASGGVVDARSFLQRAAASYAER